MSNATQSVAAARINSLLDANSFVEIGQAVTARTTDFNMTEKKAPSDGVITGYGVIDGSLVYVYSQDASVLNGTVGEMHAKKIAKIYDLALKVGAPVIGLVDCAGLRLQEDVYKRQGETQKAETMIKCIVIASGNDASVAMAEHLAGTEQAFVEQMNQRAEKLGMKNTHFVDCCGLTESKDHYTTPYDIALMSLSLIHISMCIRDRYEYSAARKAYKTTGTVLQYDSEQQLYVSEELLQTADNTGKFKITETRNPKGYEGKWEQEVDISDESVSLFLEVQNKNCLLYTSSCV